MTLEEFSRVYGNKITMLTLDGTLRRMKDSHRQIKGHGCHCMPVWLHIGVRPRMPGRRPRKVSTSAPSSPRIPVVSWRRNNQICQREEASD